MTWRPSALIAFLLMVPIGIMFASIVFHIEAIELFMKSFLTEDGETPSLIGRAYMLGALLALPVAFLVALIPWFRTRQLPWPNLIAALLALLIMLPIAYGLGEEFYRCEIAHIPNCD